MMHDVIIVGGGLAGLSLAVLLAGGALDVLVVEPRTGYVRDRTWCYRDFDDHPFGGAVSHSWERWRVRDGRGETVVNSRRHPYRMIPADRLYAHALRLLQDAPNVRLMLGAAVSAVDEDAASAGVVCRGRRLRAR